jgi:hypothetical protein
MAGFFPSLLVRAQVQTSPADSLISHWYDLLVSCQ